MEKTILIVKRFQYSSKTPTYNIEKSAKTLEEAMKYKIALELLNNEKETTYLLFNEVGQFEIERIEKVADATK